MTTRRTLPQRAAILLLTVGLGACSSQIDNTLSGRPTLNTARVALNSGATEVALNICTQLLIASPRDTGLLVCKGDALTALGRPGEAVAAYEAALAQSPRSGDAKVGLGRVSLIVNPQRAEQLFLDALTSNPRNSVALNNLGIARDLQGRHTEAQAAYAQAIGADPTNRAPQVNLALSMAMSGQPQQAEQMLRPMAFDSTATAKERHDYAAVLALAGRTAEAKRVLAADLSPIEAEQAVASFQALGPGARPTVTTPSSAPAAPIQLQSAATSSAAPVEAEVAPAPEPKSGRSKTAEKAPPGPVASQAFPPDVQAPSGPIVLQPPMPDAAPEVKAAEAKPEPAKPAARPAKDVASKDTGPVTSDAFPPPAPDAASQQIVLQPAATEPAPAEPAPVETKPGKKVASKAAKDTGPVTSDAFPAPAADTAATPIVLNPAPVAAVPVVVAPTPVGAQPVQEAVKPGSDAAPVAASVIPAAPSGAAAPGFITLNPVAPEPEAAAPPPAPEKPARTRTADKSKAKPADGPVQSTLFPPAAAAEASPGFITLQPPADESAAVPASH